VGVFEGNWDPHIIEWIALKKHFSPTEGEDFDITEVLSEEEVFEVSFRSDI
jgi:hypothetical protein